MLKDILKYTERAKQSTTDLNKALEVMRIVPKAANDMMNVGRLHGYDGKITAQGKLLLQDILLVMEQTTARSRGERQALRERRVFLFEQEIIFSEEMDKKKNNMSHPGYIYKNSMKINNMALQESSSDDPPLVFTLIDKKPKADLKLTCQAQSDDVTLNWISHIRSLLDMQGDFLRALQSPIAYQKELTKELSAPEINVLQHGSVLRKTHSQPHSTKNSTNPLMTGKAKDAYKRSSKKSVPTTKGSEVESAKPEARPSFEASTSDPSLQKLRSEDRGLRSKSNSPQPKRNIIEGIRCTLMPFKSRSQEDLFRQGGASGCPSAEARGVIFCTAALAVGTGANAKLRSISNAFGKADAPSDRSRCRTEDASAPPTAAVHNRELCDNDSRLMLTATTETRRLSQGFKCLETSEKISSQSSEAQPLCDPDSSFEAAPSVLKPLSDVSVEAGRTAVLECCFCGRPQPSVSWTRPGQEGITSSSSSSSNVTLSYLDNGTTAAMEIRNASFENSGQYTCRASNCSGSVATSGTLTVSSPVADEEAEEKGT